MILYSTLVGEDVKAAGHSKVIHLQVPSGPMRRMHAVTAKKGCVRTSENPIHRVSLFSFWLNLNNSKLSFTVVVDLALRSFVRHNHGTPQWVGITSICSELVFCECNQGFLQIIELLQDSDSI